MHPILEERFIYYGYDVFKHRFHVQNQKLPDALFPLWVEWLGMRLMNIKPQYISHMTYDSNVHTSMTLLWPLECS